MHIIGIDPGVTGAIASYNTGDHYLLVRDIPAIAKDAKGRRQVDVHALTEMIEAWPDNAHVFMEQSQPMPRQGSVSTFNYGVTYGILYATILAYSYALTLVRPNEWKKGVRGLTGGGKEASLRRAGELFPERSRYYWSRKCDHNRAEAALIAYYGAMQMGAFK